MSDVSVGPRESEHMGIEPRASEHGHWRMGIREPGHPTTGIGPWASGHGLRAPDDHRLRPLKHGYQDTGASGHGHWSMGVRAHGHRRTTGINHLSLLQPPRAPLLQAQVPGLLGPRSSNPAVTKSHRHRSTCTRAHTSEHGHIL
jgi:hypothetical protein